MKRIIALTMGMVFLLATAGYAMQHGGGMKNDKKWWKKPAIVDMINFSAEEESKANDMWVQHRRIMIKLKGNLRLEKFELEVLDDKKDFDATAFRAQFDKFQNARAAVDAERINFRAEVRNMLGAERFLKIRSQFPLYGKEKTKSGKEMKGMTGCKKMKGCKKMMGGKGGMMGMKGMHDMKGGKSMGMEGMHGKMGGKGMKGKMAGKGGCGSMKGSSMGESDAEGAAGQDHPM